MLTSTIPPRELVPLLGGSRAAAGDLAPPLGGSHTTAWGHGPPPPSFADLGGGGAPRMTERRLCCTAVLIGRCTKKFKS